MNPLKVLRLELYAPLCYIKDAGLKPFEGTDVLDEILFCFDINPDQCLSIEPDKDHYLGDIVFGGALESQPDPVNLSEGCELPAGKYLFAQARDILSRERFIWMAVEVQKEGLWEQVSLDRRLYLRYLFEDGKGVTQVFRPLLRQEM